MVKQLFIDEAFNLNLYDSQIKQIKEHGIALCSFSIACFAIWVGSFSENKRLRSPCEPKNALAMQKNYC